MENTELMNVENEVMETEAVEGTVEDTRKKLDPESLAIGAAAGSLIATGAVLLYKKVLRPLGRKAKRKVEELKEKAAKAAAEADKENNKGSDSNEESNEE